MVYFIEILRGNSKHVNFNMKSDFLLWLIKNKSPVRVIAIFSNSIKFFRINPVFSHKIFWKSFNHTSTSIKQSQLLFRPEFLKDSDAIYKISTEKLNGIALEFFFNFFWSEFCSRWHWTFCYCFSWKCFEALFFWSYLVTYRFVVGRSAALHLICGKQVFDDSFICGGSACTWR